MDRQPICPNDTLEEFRLMIEGCRRNWDYKISDRNLEAIALVFERIQQAQDQDRVLPDPNDGRSWLQAVSDAEKGRFARTLAQRAG